MSVISLEEAIRVLFDAEWYRQRYPDISAAETDPLEHFLRFGLAEGRNPNAYFDANWYLAAYPDVASSGMAPLLHYLQFGAAEFRNPHPRFDAAHYVFSHPEAAANPLFFHITQGAAQGFATERAFAAEAYLAAPPAQPAELPPDLLVDVVIPVYRGLAETQACLASVFAAREAPLGDIIVIDDCSPEPALAAWLDGLNKSGKIRLIRPPRNQGFVAAVNRGMQAAGRRDVVLLNSDTEVPRGWLARLAAHAYAAPRIASVSPFSNNATICSYPATDGSGLALGLDLAAIDAAAAAVNAGRAIDLPVTVGFCMYLTREAIEQVGLFDVEIFGHGYGEEVDFCLRATARGFRHVLAADVFVYHAGEVSFGRKSEAREAGMSRVAERYPLYPRIIDLHVRFGAADPPRFALTAELFRRSRKPTLLMVSHDLGGGIAAHVERLNQRCTAQANLLWLRPDQGGIGLAVPSLPGHPVLQVPNHEIEGLARLLENFQVRRIHVHHLMRFGDFDLRALGIRLNVPIDVTVHDYFAICPQVNLLPWFDAQYCGEPGPATCNACINTRPAHGARDILEWRTRQRWLFETAERVLCPTEDVRARLTRFGLGKNARLAPHEPTPASPWPLRQNPLGRKLRIALLGVLANQKGLPSVAALAETTDPAEIDFYLIGHPEQPLTPELARRLHVSGEYADADLPKIIARTKPNIIWFPAQWPETWSYTLSAAIASGLPIIASNIGAFPERLEGRPLTWLVAPDASPATWRETFEIARKTLARNKTPPCSRPRRAVADFYAGAYLAPLVAPALIHRGPHDLRRPGRTSVVLIPELSDNGAPSPCAYIRLCLPLDHPAIGGEIDLHHARPSEALGLRADIIATQRHAIPDTATAQALAAHCRATGARLLYDLDDDLLDIPPEHPEIAALSARVPTVRAMIAAADTVWTSTAALQTRLARHHGAVKLIENGLDERLWGAARPALPHGPLRVLVMGTRTHGSDFRLIEGALARLKTVFEERIVIDVCGMTEQYNLPPGIHRIGPPPGRGETYPAFIAWLASLPGWHLGLAPLADTPFNEAKSAIKTLDYAALGLATLASDTPAYRTSLANGPGGFLVENTETAWFHAIARLTRDPALRTRLATGAQTAYQENGTLIAQAETRRTAWAEALSSTPPRRAAAKRRQA